MYAHINKQHSNTTNTTQSSHTFANNRSDANRQSKLQSSIDNSSKVSKLQTNSAITNAPIQGMFTYRGHPLSAIQIGAIQSYLHSQGEDKGSDFTKNANKKKDFGAVSEVLKNDYGITESIKSILSGAKGKRRARKTKIFGTYDSDDDADMSDGESVNLYRANQDMTMSVKQHSMYSVGEQARISIRQMRDGLALTNPNPTILGFGDQFFEFNPTPARKDFGVSNMRRTDDGKGLQRAGNPRTYEVLGKALDATAIRCGLTMAEMNDAIKTLFTNKDANSTELGVASIDDDGLGELREVSAILLLDMARSHNGRTVIEGEFLNNTSSFADRLGGKAPEYGGAQTKKKHKTGGVEYLKNYDADDDDT